MAKVIVEVTPLVNKTQSEPVVHNVLYTTLKNLTLIALWYFFGTTLSLLNKHLIGGKESSLSKGRFPAPLLMTSIQFLVQFILCHLFLDLGLVERKQTPPAAQSWQHYFKNVVPNGLSTGIDIGFSNLSLRTISLSFYTMCKSTTPLFLLLFAFIWKLEKPSCNLCGIMAVISTGILLLVYGETKFNPIGFSLVMSASCLAGLRWTLTQLVLQGNNSTKGHHDSGPLELLEKLTPIMSLVLLVISVCFEKLHKLPENPYFDSMEQAVTTLGMIIALGIIAFLLVWTEFKVIKETSALTFMVAGTCREVVTVGAAVLIFDEVFQKINAVGLAVLLFGVSLFNFHKYQKLRSELKSNDEGRTQELANLESE